MRQKSKHMSCVSRTVEALVIDYIVSGYVAGRNRQAKHCDDLEACPNLVIMNRELVSSESEYLLVGDNLSV
jgi:hypothetical protein